MEGSEAVEGEFTEERSVCRIVWRGSVSGDGEPVNGEYVAEFTGIGQCDVDGAVAAECLSALIQLLGECNLDPGEFQMAMARVVGSLNG